MSERDRPRRDYSGTVASELQRLVDNLATRLKRSVAIDDPHLRLICHTSHEDEVDELRMVSIMKRAIPPEQVAWVKKQGAHKAKGIFAVPPQPALGMTLHRTGVALRHHDVLLGFLWLLTPAGDLTADETNLLTQGAETAALLLHREQLMDEVSRGRERELMRDLLSPDPGHREFAAAELVESGLFASGVSCTAFAIVPQLAGDATVDDGVRTALADALDTTRRDLPARQSLAIVRPDHAVLLVASSSRVAQKDLVAIGEGLVAAFVHDLGREVGSAIVGIGRTVSSLTSAGSSLGEAQLAASVALLVPSLGRVVRHGDLGVYGLIAELPGEKAALGIHPGLGDLLTNPSTNDQVLIKTLEVFLDNAGDVRRTAELLTIHRASLYYRLKRIEEVMGVDLSSGDDRLALHLGLKVAKLQQRL